MLNNGIPCYMILGIIVCVFNLYNILNVNNFVIVECKYLSYYFSAYGIIFFARLLSPKYVEVCIDFTYGLNL